MAKINVIGCNFCWKQFWKICDGTFSSLLSEFLWVCVPFLWGYIFRAPGRRFFLYLYLCLTVYNSLNNFFMKNRLHTIDALVIVVFRIGYTLSVLLSSPKKSSSK